MADRTTKALLFAIALGLWMNVAGAWLRPVPVYAQVESHLLEIVHEVGRIARGTCPNKKIC